MQLVLLRWYTEYKKRLMSVYLKKCQKNIATNFYLKSEKSGSNNKVELCWRTVDQIQKPGRNEIVKFGCSEFQTEFEKVTAYFF